MSETPKKDHTGTLLRMAGNIAGGMIDPQDVRYLDTGNALYSQTYTQSFARAALSLAREILKQAGQS